MDDEQLKYVIRIYKEILMEKIYKEGTLKRKDIVELVDKNDFSALLDIRQKKTILNHLEADIEVDQGSGSIAVSYTHLTLPTIYSV